MRLYRDSIADIYCRLSVTNILYFYRVQVFFVLDNTLTLLFIILSVSRRDCCVGNIHGQAGYAYLWRTADIFAILQLFHKQLTYSGFYLLEM